MKNPLQTVFGKKPKSAAEIEKELAKLAGKLADHQRRRSELLQSAEEARAAWRDSLADDDDVIAAAKAKVDQLERQADDAARTIAEYESAIADAQERFRLTGDQERRSAAAAALETTAKKVDALAPEFEKDVAKVAATARKLMTAIPLETGVFNVSMNARPDERPEKGNGYASRREAVAAVLAEVLLAELPELFDFMKSGNYTALGLLAVADPEAQQVEAMAWHRRDVVGLPAASAIDALISSRLRGRADRIRAGEIEPDSTSIKISKPYRPPAPPVEVRIVGLRNFRFLAGEPGWKPHTKIIAQGSADYIHEAVASAAISRGWAAQYDSNEGQAAIERQQTMRSQRVGALTPDDCSDLGDPLGLQRAYEIAKAEAEAHNPDAAEAARAVG